MIRLIRKLSSKRRLIKKINLELERLLRNDIPTWYLCERLTQIQEDIENKNLKAIITNFTEYKKRVKCLSDYVDTETKHLATDRVPRPSSLYLFDWDHRRWSIPFLEYK